MRWLMKAAMGLGVLCVVATALAGPAGAVQQVRGQFQWDNPGVGFYLEGNRITRVYGPAFMFGSSPEDTAAGFVQNYAALFGVSPGDLVAGNHFNDQFTQPMMYDPDTGTDKFTLVYYAQYQDGVPVFRAELRLLVRNETGYPLVLAASNLRDLGGFAVSAGATDNDPGRLGHAAAVALVPDLVNFTPSQYVVWAGIDEMDASPRLAVQFVADNGIEASADEAKWLFLADANTGEILYRENLIVDTDVVGTVHGLATTLPKADHCNPEVDTSLPFARAAIGAAVAYADASGNFTIPNPGNDPVLVESGLRGRWFRVYNKSAADTILTLNVTPPGPAKFLHNAANTNEYNRAEVNAYLEANRVRSFALEQDPNYPVIKTQQEFTTNVNIASTCNAYYNGSSINFYRAGGSCANTAFSVVVHHEYGHHLVAVAGSGQGAYGEGMGDCMGVLITDDPVLAYGFYVTNCNGGIRNAENSILYPCSGEIHYCGQLLSGCVWDTRKALTVDYPDTYRSIIARLTVNSIKLHTGTAITPQIALDFLTLDDDDQNINNGTPHYAEICTGFGAHNMGCPQVQSVLSVRPETPLNAAGKKGGPFAPGALEYTLKNVGTAPLNYQVTSTQPWVTATNASGQLGPGATTKVNVSVNANANSLPAGVYTAAVNFINLTNHQGDTTRGVQLRVGAPEPVYTWNLDTNPGWSPQGQWAWGPPTGQGGERGYPDPAAGHTGTNVYGYNLVGDYAHGLSEQHLTTTAINCSTLRQVSLRFWRWLGVEGSGFDHAYVRVSNDGNTWATVWENPGGPIADNAWALQELDLRSYADKKPTVYVRWTMGSTDGAWAYCGWNLDDVEIWGVPGLPNPVGDVNCDGVVNNFDIDPFVVALSDPAGYEQQYPNCDRMLADCNNDGIVDNFDIDAFVKLLNP